MPAEFRQTRIPLFARVETPADVNLGPMYAHNISSGGVYLKAPGASAMQLPLGSGLDLQFLLPDGGPRVKLGGEVVWVDPVARDYAGERALGLGVRFSSVDAAVATRLKDLVESFRYRVVTLGLDDVSVAEGAFGDLFPLERVADFEALEDAARSGQVGLVLLNEKPGETTMLGLLEQFVKVSSERRPPVFYCAERSSPALETILEAHARVQFVRVPFERIELRSRVSCAIDTFVISFQKELLSDELSRTLERVSRENAWLRDRIDAPGRMDGIVGESAPMRKVFELIERVAPLSTAVMVLGETGTGKELVASAIVARSQRKAKPFIVQNCAAFSETLLDNELFGHARGAYTGADRETPGLFEAADGGTIFLDEIGEMPASMQPKLLRVLENGEVRRLGESKARTVDVRLLCATHRDLDQLVRDGTFRADLLYRLRTFVIAIPPLRERRDDVPLLADHFLQRVATRHGLSCSLSGEAKALLQAQEWPGNARELQHTMERLCVLADAQVIDARAVREVLGLSSVADVATSARPLSAVLEDYERELVRAELERSGGVVARAARALGVERTTLTRRLRQLGLRGPAQDSATPASADERDEPEPT